MVETDIRPSAMAAARVRTSGGKVFSAERKEPLLQAAARADVMLPHSCRTGRCSTCKARVLGGSTEALQAETGLSAAQRDAGWILTCVRSALSDTELDIEDLGDVRLPPVRTLPCRIQTLERLSNDVVEVALRLPPANDFAYFPGQYVEVIGQAGVRRSYSIANAPRPDKLIRLHIRQVAGGTMSAYWFDRAKVDDLLRLNGPLGSFFVRQPQDVDLVFLATGTGIAPVKAMLEGLALSQPRQQSASQPRFVSVLWGGRTASDLYCDVERLLPPGRFTPVLSRADAHWSGARGYVQNVALRQGHRWDQAAVYACGSTAMIEDAQRQLTAAGLSERRFFSDAFVCSAAA